MNDSVVLAAPEGGAWGQVSCLKGVAGFKFLLFSDQHILLFLGLAAVAWIKLLPVVLIWVPVHVLAAALLFQLPAYILGSNRG